MESGWTVDTLKQYIDELRKSDKEAIAIALSSAEKAVVKAETGQKDYNQFHNDLQRKMEAQYKDMIPRTEFNAYKESVDKAQRLEKERGDLGQGKGIGMKDLWGYILAIIGLYFLLKSNGVL